MAYRIFTVPIQSSEAVEAELNLFLRTHRVLAVVPQFVDCGPQSSWSFCVDYREGAAPSAGSAARSAGSSKPRIDYREVLPADQFALYAQLRDLRKDLAQTEAVPPYMIFTNEQLAKIVQSGATTRSDLAKIDGLGDARLDKYGPQVLQLLSRGVPDTAAKVKPQ